MEVCTMVYKFVEKHKTVQEEIKYLTRIKVSEE